MAEKMGYLKGDLRRMLCVLAAIDLLGERAGLHKISMIAKLDRRTTQTQINQACEQAGVVIDKSEAGYRIVDWGPIIKASGARKVLDDLGKPEVQESIAAGLNQRADRRRARDEAASQD